MKKRIITLLVVLAMMIPCFAAFGGTTASAATSSEGILPFTDIASSHWAYPYAEFCYANGFITGQGNTYTFAGSAKLTRATFVVILARVMEADVSWYTWSTFSDCPKGTWYTPSVMWASENGYVNGTGAGKFSPDGVMTREQAAVMFARILRTKGYGEKGGDAYLYDLRGASSWAIADIKFVINHGLMSSTVSGGYTFSPLTSMTREQVAKMFTSFACDFSSCSHANRAYATCTLGDRCTSCGLKFSLANGHDVPGLTCSRGGYCNTCGYYVDPDSGLHNFTYPTCTEDGYCLNCWATGAPALGHTTSFGICQRCYQDVFPSEYYRVAYYMTMYGEDNYDGTYDYYFYDVYTNNQEVMGSLEYDANNGSFCFYYTQTTASGQTYAVTFDIPYYSYSYTTYIFAWDYYGDTFIEGDGYISYGNYYNIYYSYDSSYSLSTIENNIDIIYDNAFDMLDDVLYDLCYSGLYSAFGI